MPTRTVLLLVASGLISPWGLARAAEVAGAAPPLAHAILAPDGSYDLVIQPPRGWEEAEIVVSGDGAHDVGAVGEDEPLRLVGVTTVQGTLGVEVQAVTPDAQGVTWVFSVEPELVPAFSPGTERVDGGKRGIFSIFSPRARGEG